MKAMRAKESFAASGGTLTQGTVVPDSHPMVKQYPSLFEDVEDYLAREFPHLQEPVTKPRRGRGAVEQATAAPGEKRAVSPPEKKG